MMPIKSMEPMDVDDFFQCGLEVREIVDQVLGRLEDLYQQVARLAEYAESLEEKIITLQDRDR